MGEVLEALAIADTPHRRNLGMIRMKSVLLSPWKKTGVTSTSPSVCLVVNEAIGGDAEARILSSTFADKEWRSSE